MSVSDERHVRSKGSRSSFHLPTYRYCGAKQDLITIFALHRKVRSQETKGGINMRWIGSKSDLGFPMFTGLADQGFLFEVTA